MLLSYLLLTFAVQAPPQAPNPAADPAADPALQAFLAGERQYAQHLGGALGEDLRDEWSDYLEDEHDKARERASGEHDDDDAALSFGAYMDNKYRRRVRPGIILFSVGFAPLGFGLYTGLTLGEASEVGLTIAGLGGALIVTGAVLWGVRGAQLQRYREVASSLRAPGRQARVQWRGLAPLYNPHTRTGGVSLGFAF